jgi:hypothetical protein
MTAFGVFQRLFVNRRQPTRHTYAYFESHHQHFYKLLPYQREDTLSPGTQLSANVLDALRLVVQSTKWLGE